MEVVIASVILNKVYDHLKSPLVKNYRLTAKALKNIKKLESKMSTIVAVMEDAELRQVADRAIINMIKKLRDACYDVDDVLDIYATDTLRQRKGADTIYILRLVSDFFSWSDNPILFRNRLGRKIKAVEFRLNEITDERKSHLKELDGGVGAVIGYRDQTISFLNQAGHVVGRHTEKEKLVELLLRSSGGGGCEKLEVVCISGMAGVGKTTLAKLVYNDERVEDRFDVRVWVYVSDDFNLKKIMRAIIEGISKEKCEFTETESLQGRLREILRRKRFLLILDDVWKETVSTTTTPSGVRTSSNWKTLKELLVSEATPGCKVLVTTRDRNIDSEMGNTHHLGILPEDECFALFKQLVFGSEMVEENDEMMAVGRRIVKKCQGLPLALKILGGLVRSKKRSIQEWETVEKNYWCDVGRDPQDILPTLRLSYNHLPLKSRFCFAYCSIFPKGYEFDKMELIQQWIANGFVLTCEEKDLEELGSEIFEDLLSRNLFQDPKEDDYGCIVKCRIHDLVHNFATTLVEEECRILSIRKNKVDEKTRYLSIHEVQSSEIPKEVYEAKKLRTMLSFSRDVVEKGTHLISVFQKLKFLRVLNLQMTNIEDVPSSIKNLKHLRYVDFSSTRIKVLPESTSSLLNLQTLRLNRCRHLESLPRKLKNLSCLRVLEIEGSCLHAMPVGMDKLSNLRILTDFTISQNGASLKELRELKLGGKLSIWRLENTRINERNHLDSVNPNLSSKSDLEYLNLSWTNNIGNNSETDANIDNDVFKALKPHSYLKKLKAVGYGGTCLPTWITDSRRHLVEVYLAHCSSCECLPAFGQLAKLEDLQLIGFTRISKIDADFYGQTINGFASLRRLSFSAMPNFNQWVAGPGFRKLNSLTIRDCPLLEDMPEIPTLHRLDLWNCHAKILSCVANLTSLSTLIICKIPNLKTLKGFGNLTSLRKLMIVDCIDLKSFSGNAMRNLTSLKQMEITGCRDLKSLPGSMCHLKSLTTLNIKQCVRLAKTFPSWNHLTSLKSIRIVESLHTEKWGRSGVSRICCHTEEYNIQICHKHTSLDLWLRYPANLKELRIHGDHGFIRYPDLHSGNSISICCCKTLNVLPNRLQNTNFLEDLEIRDCPELKNLPERLGELNKLKDLHIIDCPGLTCLPGKLTHVQFLRISGCPLLEQRCVEHGQDWPFISHIPDRRIGEPLIVN